MSWPVIPPDPKCDFCSGRPPVTVYPCRDFMFVAVSEANVIEQPSVGAWLACWVCSTLIDSDSWESLAERAVERQGGRPEGRLGDMIADMMQAWIESFREHRLGDPEPLS